MRIPKVALISEEYPPYHLGGIGTFCYNLARLLSEKRIPTTVFSGRSRRVTKERVNDFLEVVRLPIFDFPPRFLWFQFQNLSNLLKLLRDCDVIHALSPEISPFCVYLKRALNKPLVTSYHGADAEEMKSFIASPFSLWTATDFARHVLEYPLYDEANRLSIERSDHIICCSHIVLNELRNSYKSFNPTKASVIYNGIDLNDINNLKGQNKNKRKSNDLTLIHYGRLVWAKGTVYAINAFKLLLREYPNLTFKIFGKGPIEEKIRSQVYAAGLRSRIQFFGQVPRTELLAEIANADVVVLPSLREAQPISVLEAMASSKPVVVFDLPFASEYVKDMFNGVSAKAKDHVDLAKKIRLLLCDESLRERIGRNAFEYVRQNHNWDVLIEKYIDVYSGLTNSQ